LNVLSVGEMFVLVEIKSSLASLFVIVLFGLTAINFKSRHLKTRLTVLTICSVLMTSSLFVYRFRFSVNQT